MRRKSILSRALLAAALAATTAAATLVTASPATAGTNYNGVCESGEVCVYYYMDLQGAMADFYDAVSDYSNWHFWNSSYWLNDNTMSASNRGIWFCVMLSLHANHQGATAELSRNHFFGSLGPTLNNEVSSHHWDICPGDYKP